MLEVIHVNIVKNLQTIIIISFDIYERKLKNKINLGKLFFDF